MQRWFVDGEVQCFAGGHLPLALVAIVILLICALAIMFVFVTAVKEFQVLSESVTSALNVHFSLFYVL